MAAKIAVVGSRTFGHPNIVIGILEQTLQANGPFTLVSGGAEGPDTVAEQWARHKGLAVEVFPADWEQFGDAAGPKRNSLIVGACEAMLAFWDGESEGTLDSITKAKKLKKPVGVFLG